MAMAVTVTVTVTVTMAMAMAMAMTMAMAMAMTVTVNMTITMAMAMTMAMAVAMEVAIITTIITMKVKSDHRSKFSSLSNWKEEAWKNQGFNGRASHRYRGGHGFESRWSPDFFRLLLSSCLNWKIYCDDHSSLSSTTAVQIWIISYILHNNNNIYRRFHQSSDGGIINAKDATLY